MFPSFYQFTSIKQGELKCTGANRTSNTNNHVYRIKFFSTGGAGGISLQRYADNTCHRRRQVLSVNL